MVTSDYNNSIMLIKLRKVVTMGILAALLAACSGDRPNNLGVKSGLLAACPASPNCVSSQVAEERHGIAPFTFSGDPDAAFARLAKLLKNRVDTKIVEAADSYLRVEFRTRFFVDDGEFLLDRERNIIHLRSASRIGHSDLGKNRSRIEEIRRDFEKRGE